MSATPTDLIMTINAYVLCQRHADAWRAGGWNGRMWPMTAEEVDQYREEWAAEPTCSDCDEEADAPKCAWCGEVCESDGDPCDACFDAAAEGAQAEAIYGPECDACGMDGGEHFRSCRFHRDGLV